MGTEVLRPHDFLTERIRGPPAMVYPRRRNNAYNNNNNYHSNSHVTKPSRSKPKKASESMIPRRYSSDDLRQSKHNHSHHQNQLAMRQITILKRGEPLDRNLPVPNARSGPAPVAVKKQIPKSEVRSRSLSPKPVAASMPDMYAGSAFSVSPEPESLPLPSFSTKKQVSVTVDDSATRDLRRLLRLD